MFEWQDMASAPKDEHILLNLRYSIPDVPYVLVGRFTDGPDAEELGYREYAKYGAWTIWHQHGDDFYLIDVSEPLGWARIPVAAKP